jgi:hypothetical protein
VNGNQWKQSRIQLYEWKKNRQKTGNYVQSNEKLGTDEACDTSDSFNGASESTASKNAD